VINDVPGEKCESGVGSNTLNRGIHALFETDWSVTIRVSIRPSWIVVVSGRIGCGIWPTADWLGAVITSASLVEWIHMDITEMNYLDWCLSADDWTRGGRLR
jgi:hypothetical protein